MMKSAVKFAAALLAGVVTMMLLSRFYDKPKDLKEHVQQTPQALTKAVEEIKESEPVKELMQSEPVKKIVESEPIAKLNEQVSVQEEAVENGSGEVEEVKVDKDITGDVAVVERTIEERQQDVTRRQFEVIEGLLD